MSQEPDIRVTENKMGTQPVGRLLAGMAIADSLVRLMGGEIVIDSEVGRGSDMSVYLALDLSDEATVAIDAPKTLAYGENVLRITVTAYDGSITVYTLIVVRTPPEEEESGAESVPPADSSAAAESRTEEPAGFVLWPVVTAAVVIVVGAAVLLLLRRRRAKKRTEEEYDP